MPAVDGRRSKPISMGTTQSRARPETRRPQSQSLPSSPLPMRSPGATQRWSAARLDARLPMRHSQKDEYAPTVVNARAQAFGHRDHDEVFRLLQSQPEWRHRSHIRISHSSSSCSLDDDESDTESETSQSHASLPALSTALDPLSRKVRRVSVDDEQLALVRRRASAAKAIALRGHAQHQSAESSVSNQETTAADATVTTPSDFEYLKVIGVGAWGKVVLVRHRHDAALYAMKVISKRSVREHNLAAQILSERDVLGGTHHHSLGTFRLPVCLDALRGVRRCSTY